MPQAHLLFTKHHNSFSVKVLNLEKLSVEQIKELQEFVNKRNGIFDFNTYSFSIQKRMEYFEFVDLIEHTKIDARLEEKIVLKKSEPRISFGQYKGMQYSELPDSYMLWLKVNYRGYDRKKIEKELAKRAL